MSYIYNHITKEHNVAYQEIKEFLEQNNLLMDCNVTDFIEVRDKSMLVACAGLDGNIIKCVAINENNRGSGISLSMLSEVQKLAISQGYSELFLFTKPCNVELFKAAGFYPIIIHDQVVLMENSQNRFAKFCHHLTQYQKIDGVSGAIVMNANPFTLGHQYLIQKALENCDWLHVFVVQENLSFFSFEDRYQLVQEGTKQFDRVTVHKGSDYIISRASFPNYFLKDTNLVSSSHAGLDLSIFRKFIAPALNISCRFVGTEPTDMITRQYNGEMVHYLQETQDESLTINVIEIPRISITENVISASSVRRYLADQNFDAIAQLVPDSTLKYLVERYKK
ncbi:[citrate (pro-3S)-lyase] ligase [Wohlfahrtiimonas populi]|uniref:[citrate (pro-3S)-lyase] ligase n=1 Tax=Wohlfahrtiimonas populi TaxID=1940240 RepID=UPI00098D6DB6|nr:[citrate (pro-3S)-lyase] ligase [Wohlfahrtiimonas populi]